LRIGRLANPASREKLIANLLFHWLVKGAGTGTATQQIKRDTEFGSALLITIALPPHSWCGWASPSSA
jgi:hypothetical protein